MAHGLDYIVVPVHLRPAAHAEIKAVVGAVKAVDRAFEPFEVAEDARHAAQRLHRRVVRVKRQRYAGLLGNRQQPLQVVFVVGPHLLMVEDPAMRQFFRVMFGEVEACAACAAAQPGRFLRAPDRVGHPVVAEDWNAGPAHVADRGLHVPNLLVAPGQPEHRLVVEGDGHVFQADQSQAGRLCPVSGCLQVVVLPLLVTGEPGGIHQEVIGAKLLDEGQLFVGQLIELSQADSHLRRHFSAPCGSKSFRAG